VAFAATIGMYWTSLSSPRGGTTSPVGVMPLVGIAPSILTLVLVEAAPSLALYVLAGSLALLLTTVILLLALVGRLLPLERLLSPA
jgi:hypothetical protein